MYCRNCGTSLSENTKFCGNCGTQVERIVAEKSIAMKNRMPKWGWGVLIGIVTMIVIVIGVTMDPNTTSSDTQTEDEITQNMLDEGAPNYYRKESFYDENGILSGYTVSGFNENGRCVKKEYFEVTTDANGNSQIKIVDVEEFVYIYNVDIGIWEKLLKRDWDVEYTYRFDENGRLTESVETDDYENKVLRKLCYEYTYENGKVQMITMYDSVSNEEVGFYVYKYDEEGRCISRDYKERESEGFLLGHAIEWYEWEYHENGKLSRETYTLYSSTYEYEQIITMWNSEGMMSSISWFDRGKNFTLELVLSYEDNGVCKGGNIYQYDDFSDKEYSGYVEYKYEDEYGREF